MSLRCSVNLLTTVLFLLCSLLGSAQRTSKQLHSTFRAGRSSPGWKSREWRDTRCIITDTSVTASENRMFVFSTWDKHFLYYHFKVTDSDLRAYQHEQDHAQLFLDDMIEVLMATGNQKDSCWSADDIVYHVNILGVKKDDRGTAACITDAGWNGKAKATLVLAGSLNDSTDTDQGYLMTLQFPWSEIGRKPVRGLTMGVNFANGDNDGKGRRLFDWVGAWPMRSPYAFGEIILK